MIKNTRIISQHLRFFAFNRSLEYIIIVIVSFETIMYRMFHLINLKINIIYKAIFHGKTIRLKLKFYKIKGVYPYQLKKKGFIYVNCKVGKKQQYNG